jgi:hypothetical protein
MVITPDHKWSFGNSGLSGSRIDNNHSCITLVTTFKGRTGVHTGISEHLRSSFALKNLNDLPITTAKIFQGVKLKW